ncbi:hypothetical protein L861_15345 [Litchfieldella anticariensis FP35 = DSM 16096]|uniref:Uncharacterized protein n=1 Tax=Litchfieldella anticariensis (strain DSM 16096 / CECT 5854 / CIP 108499 / LMG 22089 / FP35) TaxID=1121939 RepID=S2L866_LITA3|nr:hypothetical protein L861_15345 [Halomonas anticariensis FP35 = DSM 16096]
MAIMALETAATLVARFTSIFIGMTCFLIGSFNLDL